MNKEQAIEFEGTVEEAFPNAVFAVRLDNGHEMKAHLGGKLRKNRISILPGDRVVVEMSAYDLTKGRIVYRGKPKK